MATPARALQLLQAAEQEHLPTGEDLEQICRRDGQAGHVCGTIAVDPDKLLPRAKLVIHLTDTTLVEHEGLARSDQLQPVLADWLRDLLSHTRVTVRPVIDLNNQATSDAYECPPLMREAMGLRNPYEAFPWSTRSSDGLDLDHTIPWKPPPAGDGGATHPDNLGPLTRLAHRAKTHGHWNPKQIHPGIYLWDSADGFSYLLTGSRTISLGRTQELGRSGLPAAA
ncbi:MULTISPECIES: HNH endonuclease signature motif containing protein [unclassified Luteococcus]|uniref:HNH endonuclease signature motif containing protein n=1 Tax=unclassified Luteococcus TaxID=2639923 RepID=UPI00313D5175